LQGRRKTELRRPGPSIRQYTVINLAMPDNARQSDNAGQSVNPTLPQSDNVGQAFPTNSPVRVTTLVHMSGNASDNPKNPTIGQTIPTIPTNSLTTQQPYQIASV
jgi:hypothetical protein